MEATGDGVGVAMPPSSGVLSSVPMVPSTAEEITENRWDMTQKGQEGCLITRSIQGTVTLPRLAGEGLLLRYGMSPAVASLSVVVWVSETWEVDVTSIRRVSRGTVMTTVGRALLRYTSPCFEGLFRGCATFLPSHY